MNSNNSQEIASAKISLRKNQFGKRQRLSIAARERFSREVSEIFLEQVPLAAGETVALYWPMGAELDCKGLISELVNRNVTVGLPTIVGSNQPLVFRQFQGEDTLVAAGFGTSEPATSADIVVPDIIALPLLAFDKTGARLGYGKGFYDRTIAEIGKKPKLVGLAFSSQEVDFVPTAPHDMALDMIITETGLSQFQPMKVS